LSCVRVASGLRMWPVLGERCATGLRVGALALSLSACKDAGPATAPAVKPPSGASFSTWSPSWCSWKSVALRRSGRSEPQPCATVSGACDETLTWWLRQLAPQPPRELEQVLRQCSIGALTLLRT